MDDDSNVALKGGLCAIPVVFGLCTFIVCMEKRKRNFTNPATTHAPIAPVILQAPGPAQYNPVQNQAYTSPDPTLR
jgi:hypothetical protein